MKTLGLKQEPHPAELFSQTAMPANSRSKRAPVRRTRRGTLKLRPHKRLPFSVSSEHGGWRRRSTNPPATNSYGETQIVVPSGAGRISGAPSICQFAPEVLELVLHCARLTQRRSELQRAGVQQRID